MLKVTKSIRLVVILFISVFVVSGCSYHWSSSSGAGNMEKTTTSTETGNNMISFKLKKGDKLKVDYKSSVKEGNLKIQLEDSKGSVVEEFDVNKSGSKEVTAHAEGEYDFFARYEGFIGSFRVHVSR